MSTFLDIIHFFLSIVGVLFLIYLFRLIWKNNKWRFYPKLYKEKMKQRTAEARRNAIANKEKPYSYKNKRIWAKSFKEAILKYNALSKRDKKRLPEIF